MCKLLIVPKVENTASVRRFLRASKPYMTEVDSHGLGYAALTTTNALAIERWTEPKEAFRALKPVENSDETRAMRPLLSMLEAPESESEYSASGPIDSNWKCVMLHSRYATCAKGIDNTHPFVSLDTALIHNGVINNPDVYGKRDSTCDSEAILNGYISEGVREDALRIQEVSDRLEGYFAVGVLAKGRDGSWILDVIKDDSARLFCAYIPKLRTPVFCTSETILKKTCKALKWKMGKIYPVRDATLLRFDASTGQLIETAEFISKPPTPIMSETARHALGYSADAADVLDPKLYEIRDDEWLDDPNLTSREVAELAADLEADSEGDDYEMMRTGGSRWAWRRREGAK